VAEFQLIEQWFAPLAPGGREVQIGIGDDAAVLRPPPGRDLVMTMDTLVEGRHFLPGSDAAGLGHKALAVNLSDLAAMGAEPAWALLSLTLPQADEQWLAAFSEGLGALARASGVALVGGDTCRGPLSITLQLTGSVAPERALLRGGAHPGDRLFVTGTLGDAAVALRRLQAGEAVAEGLRRRLERPTPRLAEGRALVDIASACIDLSDGLVADLGHLCAASGCGARVEAARVPRSAEVAAWLQATGDWQPLLGGGDDYELCFTVPESRLARLERLSLDCTEIGRMVAGEGVTVVDEKGRPLQGFAGWDHFA
jgi:thiamine-monophosphate kinase